MEWFKIEDNTILASADSNRDIFSLVSETGQVFILFF